MENETNQVFQMATATYHYVIIMIVIFAYLHVPSSFCATTIVRLHRIESKWNWDAHRKQKFAIKYKNNKQQPARQRQPIV